MYSFWCLSESIPGDSQLKCVNILKVENFPCHISLLHLRSKASLIVVLDVVLDVDLTKLLGVNVDCVHYHKYDITIFYGQHLIGYKIIYGLY